MKPIFSEKRVYELLRTVPSGRVITYGQIAAALGNPMWARAVGNALHKNPDGDLYPCYKAVNGKGELSPFYAFGGLSAQRARLEAEGISVRGNRVDLRVYGMEILYEGMEQ